MVRSFPYVEAALKEALRVFPTAPTLVRETSRAVSLGGYSLAKGQVVAVSVYSMHHNQAYWDVRPCPSFLFGQPSTCSVAASGLQTTLHCMILPGPREVPARALPERDA